MVLGLGYFDILYGLEQTSGVVTQGIDVKPHIFRKQLSKGFENATLEIGVVLSRQTDPGGLATPMVTAMGSAVYLVKYAASPIVIRSIPRSKPSYPRAECICTCQEITEINLPGLEQIAHRDFH